MSEVPEPLSDVQAPQQVAGLLCVGWPHAEIANAVDISKGTVQNYRDQLEDGNIAPPPELFPLIRPRERAFHRAGRKSDLDDKKLTEQLSDRLELIVDLDLLDIHPEAEIDYEDLTAFAALIAGRQGAARKSDIVDQLSRLYNLGCKLPADPTDLLLQLRYQYTLLLVLQASVDKLRRKRKWAKVTPREPTTPGSDGSAKGGDKVEQRWRREDTGVGDLREPPVMGPDDQHTESATNSRRTISDVDKRTCESLGGKFEKSEQKCYLENKDEIYR